MKFRFLVLPLALALALVSVLLAVGFASAHANLISANIKNHEVFRYGHTPHQIVAKFAQELDPAKSWMAVFEGVADHGLVTEHQHSKVSFKNPKVMTLTLPKLQPDKYYLIWYTHSLEDGHYAAGVVYFSVVK
jgi:methionine-rich copper-binding protein CopC